MQCDQCNNPATLTLRGYTNAWAERGVFCYSIGDLKAGCDIHLPILAEDETAEYWEDKFERELQGNTP